MLTKIFNMIVCLVSMYIAGGLSVLARLVWGTWKESENKAFKTMTWVLIGGAGGFMILSIIKLGVLCF